MIESYLKAFQILTPKDIEDFLNVSKTKSLKKNDFLIKEGDTCHVVAFINQGIMRSFFESGKENETTYCITFPNNFITSYTSFITGKPSEENIQAITPVELLVIDKGDVQALSENSLNWTKFLKKVAEYQYMELEKRIFQLHKNDATQRYQELMKSNPEYSRHIPLQYLASYLGITQRHLSRIRKEIY